MLIQRNKLIDLIYQSQLSKGISSYISKTTSHGTFLL